MKTEGNTPPADAVARATATLHHYAPAMYHLLCRLRELYEAECKADSRVVQPHGCNLHAGMEQDGTEGVLSLLAKMEAEAVQR